MNVEDLKKRDFVLVIDKSGSMADMGLYKKSKWDEAQEMTVSLTRTCEKYDSDGVSVVTFSDRWKEYKNIKAAGDQIKNIFTEQKPQGGTNTAGVLKYLLDEYFKNPAKPVTILVVTDGTPNDPQDVRDVIINATKKMAEKGMPDEAISISFLQIGNDKGARTFLKELDDELQKQGAKFDIVDTKDYEEMAELSSYEQLLLESVTD